MKLLSTFTILSFCLVFMSALQGQNKEKGREVIFRGRVTAESTDKPIAFATVVKTAYSVGTISDTLGYFALPLRIGELVKISAIGFIPEYVYVRDSMVRQGTYFKNIKLQTEYYKLAEINIYDIRWQEFKKTILEMEIPDNRAEIINEWVNSALSEDFVSGLRATTPGIPINLRSKYDKQRILVAHLESDKERQRKANRKVYYLANRYTGLKDKELMRFVNFCRFSTDYILSNNDYDITIRIKRIYQIYLRQRQ